MPTITITVPDDTYERLTRLATATGTTVEALAVPALEQLAEEPPSDPLPATPPVDLPHDEWHREFKQILARAQSRAHLYPPGFQADVSREAMYEGCGE